MTKYPGINTMIEEPIQETEPVKVQGDIQDAMEETEPIPLEPITDNLEKTETEIEQIEVSQEDCEMLYGVVMETGHSIIGTRKGNGHRELPEERRKAQGKMLYSICKKYNIKIPTELEIIIFGGAIVADWTYMTVKKEDQEKLKQEIKEDIRETGGIRSNEIITGTPDNDSGKDQ